MRVLLIATNRYDRCMSRMQAQPLPIGLAYLAGALAASPHADGDCGSPRRRLKRVGRSVQCLAIPANPRPWRARRLALPGGIR